MAQTLAWLFVIVAALQQPAPVLDNVDLMDLMIKPAYDELQRAAATPPQTRQAWAALYQNCLLYTSDAADE